MIKPAVLLTCTILCLCSVVAADVELGGKSVPTDKFIVFLFIGNSNMAGRNGGGDSETHPNLWNYNFSSKDWGPAKSPIHNDGHTRGDGPAMVFGKKMVEKYPDYHFGIIQNAGSSAWYCRYQKGCTQHSGGGSYYKELITDNAIHLKDKVTWGGVLSNLGIIDRAKPDGFTDGMIQIISDMREELGEERMCFLVGQYEMGASGRFDPSGSGAQSIIRQINALPDKIDRCAAVQTDGLGMSDDHHYSWNGWVEWADRAWTQFQDNDFDFWANTVHAGFRLYVSGNKNTEIPRLMFTPGLLYNGVTLDGKSITVSAPRRGDFSRFRLGPLSRRPR
jgi:hypothetical protein